MVLKIFYATVLLACLLAIQGANGDDTRTFEVVVNPNCTLDACKNEPNSTVQYNLVYVKATGAHDILHMLYSSISTFTILLFKTNLTATINVDWNALLTNNETQMYESIRFNGSPILKSSGYFVPTIYEFNDTDGSADMTKKTKNLTQWVVYETEKLNWTFVHNDTSKNHIGSFRGQAANQNGSFLFNVRYYGKQTRDTDLPHYLISADSSSVDFLIDSIEPKFEFSKFAVQFYFITDLEGTRVNTYKSLDDEYTPGTFQQWTVETYDPLSSDAAKVHSYMQFKPIFYYYNDLSLENSTQLRRYELVVNNRPIPNSIALAFYKREQTRVSGLNISFGLQGNTKDGYFYSQSNYSTWAFSLGLENPAEEKISLIVTFVIFIGFGLPVLIIIIGGVVLAVKKMKKKKDSADYEQLN